MTEKKADLFDCYFDLGEDLRFREDTLYWYRKGHIIEKTFLGNQILLRLTHVDCFDDKLEGRAAEIYYDIALEELLEEKAIGKELFNRLSKVTVEKTELFINREANGMCLASMKEYDAYILCFSEIGNDPYMHEHYGKYCFTLSKTMLEHELRQHSVERLTFTDLQIMYGRKAIEYLKKVILEIVRNEFLLQNAEMILQDKLHTFIYAAKRPRFALENEVRFVICVPKDDPCDGDGIKKEEVNENGVIKKYLYLTLDKNIFYHISPSTENDPGDTEHIFSVFREREYSFLLPDEG